VDEGVLEQVLLGLFDVSLVGHYSIIALYACHCPMKCVITIIGQHVIIHFVLSLELHV
jgi:hypothetical protein